MNAWSNLRGKIGIIRGKFNRGTSTIVGSLLLIAVSTASSVLLYSWTNVFIQNLLHQLGTRFIIEDIKPIPLNNSDNSFGYELKITIRNIGIEPITISKICIKDFNGHIYVQEYDDNYVINPTKSITVTFKPEEFIWYAHKTYIIIIYINNGYFIEEIYRPV